MMQQWTSKILGVVARHTLYDMIQSSHDFEDVKAVLNDRTDWSIELFRSCCTIHLNNGNYFMLCALVFVSMAENIRMHYGRLSAEELKERVERIGYAAFAILFALLDIGSVVVRIMGFVALAGSPVLAVNLALISVSPPILPLLAYPVGLLMQRQKRESDREVETGSGAVDNGAGS